MQKLAPLAGLHVNIIIARYSYIYGCIYKCFIVTFQLRVEQVVYVQEARSFCMQGT